MPVEWLHEFPNRLTAEKNFHRGCIQNHQWRKRFAEWDETALGIPAGEALWQHIEASIAAAPAREARAVPGTQRQAFSDWLRSLWGNPAFWRSSGLAGALAALALAVGLSFFAVKASRQPVLVAVLMTDANQPGAVLRTFADGRAELTPLRDMQIPHNHSIQVWTFPNPSSAPVSVGVVQVAKTVLLDIENLPLPHSDQLFAISIEPLAGSPTGLPTGPVVMKGTASTAL